MATTWAGTPVSQSRRTATPGAPVAAPVAATTSEEEARRQASGVNPGGQGYVSGQVAPSGSGVSSGTGTARTAPGGTAGTGAGSNAPGPQGQQPMAHEDRAAQPPVGQGTGWRAQLPGGSTTQQSALSTGGPGGVTTQQSALSGAPGASGGGNTGTTSYSPLGPGITSAVSGIPIVGPALGNALSTAQVDLSRVNAAQDAAMGQAGNLNRERFDYQQGAAPYMDRVQLDLQQANETRARQQQALDALTQAAAGNAPSQAELQLQQQAARNNANAFGQAAALRGRAPGSSFLAATRQNAMNQADTNAQAAALRAGEMERARAALMGGLEGVRGQDVTTAGANANLAQQAGAANLGAQVQTNAQGQDWRKALLEGNLQAMGYGVQAATGGAQAAAGNAAAQTKANQNLLAGLTQGIFG